MLLLAIIMCGWARGEARVVSGRLEEQLEHEFSHSQGCMSRHFANF